jgi:tetratricopeptide (TPR) repeat protein
MKYPVLLVLMMMVGSHVSYSQSAKAFEKAGDKAFSQRDYGAALEYYRNAMEINTKKISLSYKYAEVARNFHAYDFAVNYYSKVLESENASDFPLTNYWLGLVKKSMGEYDVAKQYFEAFLNQKFSEGKYIDSAKKEIKSCDWAMEVIENQVEDIIIQQLNKRVNTPYSEFGSLLKGDTLYYSSLRFDNSNDEQDPPRKISKVLMSIRGSKGRTMKRSFNEKTRNTSHTTFSKDGKRIYYTICDYKENAEIRCQLYFREKDKRKRWGKAQKLPEDVNLPEFTSTHPNIGIDEKTGGEVLYFVSNRPDGKGNLDIWFCNVLKKGKFSTAKNLEKINTAENDITPFYHDSTQTLFFSSEGYKGMGGYDIFKTKKIGENWATPAHTGYPLNSSYNDVYFTINKDSTLAYFSSNRLGSMYLDETNKSCCNDIYKVSFKTTDSIDLIPPPDDSLTLVFEIPAPDPLPNPTEEIPPSTLEDFLPLALYFDNDEPDKRTRRTTTKKSYSETFLKYYERKHDYVSEYSKGVAKRDRSDAENNINLFFEKKVKRGFDYLDLFSQILLQRLKEGEKVEIFVKGFTSPRAKSDYNLHLGKRRISSVKNHFKTYNNKVFEPFLQKGQLIISERSFGETTVAAGVNDDLENQRLSIYSVEASQERRVEIVEIKRD